MGQAVGDIAFAEGEGGILKEDASAADAAGSHCTLSERDPGQVDGATSHMQDTCGIVAADTQTGRTLPDNGDCLSSDAFRVREQQFTLGQGDRATNGDCNRIAGIGRRLRGGDGPAQRSRIVDRTGRVCGLADCK